MGARKVTWTTPAWRPISIAPEIVASKPGRHTGRDGSSRSDRHGNEQQPPVLVVDLVGAVAGVEAKLIRHLNRSNELLRRLLRDQLQTHLHPRASLTRPARTRSDKRKSERSLRFRSLSRVRTGWRPPAARSGRRAGAQVETAAPRRMERSVATPPTAAALSSWTNPDSGPATIGRRATAVAMRDEGQCRASFWS
jgi:hypothetical protein